MILMARKLSTNQKIAICTLIVALAALIGNSIYQAISILNLEKQQIQIKVSLEEIKAKVGSFENLSVVGVLRTGKSCFYDNGSALIGENPCTI